MKTLKTAFLRFLWRRLPPCKEVVSLLSRERDGGISTLQRLQVKLHLLVCTWCARYARQIDLLATDLKDPRTYDHPHVPQDLLTRLKKNVRNQL